jgi:hypothetical protein
VNHYERAYRDYCNYAGKEEIDYFTMYSWAMNHGIQSLIIMYPEGFCYEIDYDEGRISGPPKNNIIEAIEDVAEAIFAIIETKLEPHDIFDDLAGLRDAAEITLAEGESPEALIEPLLKEASERWSTMLSFDPTSKHFKDNFIEACIFISSLISTLEKYGPENSQED